MPSRGTLGAPTAVIRDAHRGRLEVHGWTFLAENPFLPADYRSSADPAACGDPGGERLVLLDGLDGLFTDQPDLGVTAVGRPSAPVGVVGTSARRRPTPCTDVPRASGRRDLRRAFTIPSVRRAQRSSRGLYSSRVPSTRKPSPDRPAVGPHHARVLRSHRVARAIGLAVTGALVFVAVGAGAVYLDLKSKITVSDVSDYVVGMPTEEPPKDPSDPFAGNALNILVMGTDYRDAENAALAGEEEGMRSDTTFIVHVSGDRTRMEVVSIPRDSLVDLPSCKLPDGSTSSPRRNAMFNEAFQIGSGGVDDLTAAAACTISTVYQLTGVPITNHVVVKMTGVIGVVDAIGGVTMCFPEPVLGGKNSPELNIPAGEYTLDGQTSISFLRARKGKGMGLEMGSDLARIARQQAFIDSAIRELLSQNVITNSPQLYGVIEAVLSSISADPALADPTALAGLAFSMRNIKTSEIVFTELPVVTAASDANRVEWTSGADAIWERMINDTPPPGHEPVTDPRDDTATAADGTGAPATGTDPAAGATDPAAGATDPAAGAADPGTTAPGTTPEAPVEELRPGVCG